MLSEFIDFVDSVLPSVSPDFRDGAKNAITQFEKTGHTINYLSSSVLPELSQGDIISRVPFTYFDENGKQKVFSSDAMVISTSCHIDQKDKILLVPVFPITSFEGNETDLKRNTIYDYMYIPDNQMKDKYIGFNIVSSCNKVLIMNAIKENKIKRICSLNQIGYYFFVIKLSVYFMRKEDPDTLKERMA